MLMEWRILYKAYFKYLNRKCGLYRSSILNWALFIVKEFVVQTKYPLSQMFETRSV
jgi:hypothetical protein